MIDAVQADPAQINHETNEKTVPIDPETDAKMKKALAFLDQDGSRRRVFVYHFFNNLREQIDEKGIKIVIAKDVTKANQALRDAGDKVLNSLSFSNPQREGWHCKVDLGLPSNEQNGAIISDLPPHP